jgi:Tfp pilus assembly protein FimT
MNGPEARVRSTDLAAGGDGSPRAGRSVRSRLRSQEGVTLVEMFVVVAVLLLLAAGTLPLVGTAVGDARVRAAAEQVGTGARRARQAALAAATTYQFTLNGTTVAMACIVDTPPGNICPPNRVPDINEPMTGDVSVSPVPLTLTFDAGGAATPATFTISSGSAANYQVAVNSAGRVRVCTPTCP